MTSPLLALAGLALIDSINPSALLVTTYLLGRERPARAVTVYMAGVFVTYLSVGIGLVLGFDALSGVWTEALWSPTAYGIQGIVGLAMFAYSWTPEPEGTRLTHGRERGVRSRTAEVAGAAGLFGLGVVITGVEMTTAMPYLAAIGLLTYWQWPVHKWLAALIAYNLIFILPPFGLLFIGTVLGQRLRETRFRWLHKLESTSREATKWILGAVGFFLLADALVYFDFLGLVEVTLPGGAQSPSEYILNPKLPGIR